MSWDPADSPAEIGWNKDSGPGENVPPTNAAYTALLARVDALEAKLAGYTFDAVTQTHTWLVGGLPKMTLAVELEFGANFSVATTGLRHANLPGPYVDNAAAIGAGLLPGNFYRTPTGPVLVRY